MDKTTILGISAFYHDSAACIVVDGKIIAAAEEERFTRIKHDMSFPINAVSYCLSEASLEIDKIDYIAFYDDSKLKFRRLWQTFLTYAPKGFKAFKVAMEDWVSNNKMNMNELVLNNLEQYYGISSSNLPKLINLKHHHSHAASAFFPSPYKEAAILCIDGVGEWDTTSIWYGYENQLYGKKSIKFPHSLGLLYSAFTYFLGFKVNSGEYKVMGLAPYGSPKYVDKIYEHLVDVKPDGSFRLNMNYFQFTYSDVMVGKPFEELFGTTVRAPESNLDKIHMDIAKSIQVVLQEILVKISNHAYTVVESPNLCIAGGVALNCVANSKILNQTPFDNVWVQPAAGDSGGCIGAAMSVWYEYLGNERIVRANDAMSGSYLGPSYLESEITEYLDSIGANYELLPEDKIQEISANQIASGKVVGWFSGRMEFGPRALGNRSIFGDPRSNDMQSIMNQKIKKRESFRPFAPIIKADKSNEWFDINIESPYMLFVADVVESKRLESSESKDDLSHLNIKRSSIPAVTHLDYSARLQTLSQNTNTRIYGLLEQFESLTGCPVLINTSFNERGEPIVCTPKDAFESFMRTDIDILVLENHILFKDRQTSNRSQFIKKFVRD